MGVLNITPDSFSDGGELLRGDQPDLGLILRRAEAMLAEGADVLDVGGESTRPGATPVDTETELARVVPVVDALARRFPAALISVDTSAPAVMTASAAAGAALLNDVRALRRPGALPAAAATGLPVCLTHMRGEPGDMQDDPRYDDLVGEVLMFWRQRLAACAAAGIPRARVFLDPGFGFGKTQAQNLALFRALPTLAAQGCPLVVGLSRKRLIGAVLARPARERVHGSVAMALLAVQRGARVVRVHDVAATRDALKMLAAVNGDPY